MPDTIEFTTFMTAVILEFCFMTLLLGVIIERSMRRAFKYIEDKDALLERISQIEEEIGYCEKHKRLNNVCDAWCPDCMDEHMLMVKKREHYGVPVLASIIEDVRQAQKGEGK
jgi:hypothetical protein